MEHLNKKVCAVCVSDAMQYVDCRACIGFGRFSYVK